MNKLNAYVCSGVYLARQEDLFVRGIRAFAPFVHTIVCETRPYLILDGVLRRLREYANSHGLRFIGGFTQAMGSGEGMQDCILDKVFEWKDFYSPPRNIKVIRLCREIAADTGNKVVWIANEPATDALYKRDEAIDYDGLLSLMYDLRNEGIQPMFDLPIIVGEGANERGRGYLQSIYDCSPIRKRFLTCPSYFGTYEPEIGEVRHANRMDHMGIAGKSGMIDRLFLPEGSADGSTWTPAKVKAFCESKRAKDPGTMLYVDQCRLEETGMRLAEVMQ